MRAANAGKIFATVGDMRTLSSDGIQSALEAVKPLGADVHAQAQDLANGIMADRANDPASAMRASIPLVAKAWTAYTQDALPENLQAALKLSRAAQPALGIASDQQRLMPGDIAESDARAILSAAPSDQLSTLRDLQSRAGTYASTVLGQIDRFFAPQLRDAAVQSSNLVGDQMWRQAVADAGPNGPMPDLRLLANPTPQPTDDQTPGAQSNAANIQSQAASNSTTAPAARQVASSGAIMTDASSTWAAATGQTPAASGAQQQPPVAPSTQTPGPQRSQRAVRGQRANSSAQVALKYNEISSSQLPVNSAVIPPAAGDPPWKLSLRKNILLPSDHIAPALRSYLDSLDWSNPTDNIIRGWDTAGGGGFYDMRRGPNGTHWYHGSLDVLSREDGAQRNPVTGESLPAQDIKSPVTGRYVGIGDGGDEGPYIELDLGQNVHIRVFHVDFAGAPFGDAQGNVHLKPGDVVRSGETIGTQQYFESNPHLQGVPVHAHIQIMLQTRGSKASYLIDPGLFIHNPDYIN